MEEEQEKVSITITEDKAANLRFHKSTFECLTINRQWARSEGDMEKAVNQIVE